jgi:starvation-inducible DNA-binding protein
VQEPQSPLAKGPQFVALHPLFVTVTVAVSAFHDDAEEPAVTRGGIAEGDPRHVAKQSRLAEYPQETTKDMEHVQLLAERMDVYLESVRDARTVSDKYEEADTMDLLTRIIEAV